VPPRLQNSRTLARKIVSWFGRNARDLPWRRTRDPYAIWISEVMLQIADDGRGFSSPDGQLTAPGVGILGMRARIAQLGGELSIESGREGTTLRAKLRLDGTT